MKRSKYLHTPMRVDQLAYEDYEDEGMNDNKAQRVQIKQWRKLKHQLS
ncbi:MAG TPA: hypothetical protein VLF87_02715 [Patescibacteria group bacterium]|nr:hypothetical protein [Patescibacteria group bacterium]